MKARTILLGLMHLSLLCAIAIPAWAQISNSDFQQAVAAYQQSPSDASAEKVIRMAAAMSQLPPIPEEARRHFVRGTALFKDAKSADDYKQVADEFTQATHLAPWWPEARYNLAMALEAAGDYDNAIVNSKLYLLFKLPDTDARAAQDKVYALEARQEKASKAKAEDPSPQPLAAPPQNSFDALLKKIDGRRYTYTSDPGYTSVLDVRGRVLVYGGITPNGYFEVHTGSRHEIRGREFSDPVVDPLGCQVCPVQDTFIISEDGSSITQRRRFSDGKVYEYIHLWQR